MTRIHRNALVMHSAADMFALVNDVPAYPEFLPWCSRSEVLEHSPVVMVAKLEIAKGKLRQSFTTRNVLEEPGIIQMQLEDGPFRVFRGCWQFTPLDERACKVALDLNFEFSGTLASVLLGRVFDDAANHMIDAFCKRANDIHG